MKDLNSVFSFFAEIFWKKNLFNNSLPRWNYINMFQTQNVFRRVNCSKHFAKITLFKLNENADTSLQVVLYSSLLIKSDPQRNKVYLSNLSFNFSKPGFWVYIWLNLSGSALVQWLYDPVGRIKGEVFLDKGLKVKRN